MIRFALLFLFLAGCASPGDSYNIERTAFAINCEKSKTVVHTDTWDHKAMNGFATYEASCEEKRFTCLRRQFEFECKPKASK